MTITQLTNQFISSIGNSTDIIYQMNREAQANGLSREELTDKIIEVLSEDDKKEMRSLANWISKLLEI